MKCITSSFLEYFQLMSLRIKLNEFKKQKNIILFQSSKNNVLR